MSERSDTLDPALAERFAAIVGERHALLQPEDVAPYIVEPRWLFGGRTSLVLKPGSTEEVSQIMRLATETGTAVVPQGGNTGLVGGQIPDDSGKQIILSTARLNRIREVDLKSNTATVEAGVILQVLQEEADANDRFFPLSLASQGSCQIGGNLSSNAGGVGALAYGVARDLCLGLEVVLPTGEIFDDLRKLKKDNTGYDLKDLFIGAEGTLGIITAAVMKLYPKPKGRELAWAAVDSPETALKLLHSANEKAGTALTMFELIERTPLDLVLKHMPGSLDPLSAPYSWYVMLEISSGRSAEEARELMEHILGEALETGQVADAMIAQNVAQAEQLRRLREDMSDAQRLEGASIKHDISVPVAAVPEFIARAGEAVQKVAPGSRPVCFGHMGDGNLHYNISQPVDASREEHLSHYRAMNDAVHAIVRALGGSFSAEHGIGRMKRAELIATQSPVATDLMRRVKKAFDPAGIMNPGKVI